MEHSALFLALGLFLVTLLIYTVNKTITAKSFLIPGPLSARFSRLRFLYHSYVGDLEKDNLRLHAKYGKIVRIAPRVFSIDDPTAIKTIYSVHAGFEKSEWYKAWEVPGSSNIFSNRDSHDHARQRQQLQKFFNPSALSSYEKYVDDCVSILTVRLEERAKSQETFDIAWWLQCFAFDVIGCISFSRRFGFLDRGEDVRDLVKAVHGNQVFGMSLAVYPELVRAIFGTLIKLGELGVLPPPPQIYYRQIQDEEWEKRASKGLVKASEDDEEDSSTPKDFLTKYMELHYKDANAFTRTDSHNALGANIAAGSDTTGVTLASTLYYLFKNLETLATLRQELRQAEAEGRVSSPITFKESLSLEYLQAVVLEALRLWPSIAIPFFRRVPQNNTLIAGQFFNAGDDVGINPYVAHRNTAVFGSDVESFRPERWLKGGENSAEKLAEMHRYWLPFGVGSRTCIGKHISMLEIGKCIPEILRRFDLELDEKLLKEGPKSRNLQFVVWESLKVKAKVI